jgi:hypothetical protein
MSGSQLRGVQTASAAQPNIHRLARGLENRLLNFIRYLINVGNQILCDMQLMALLSHFPAHLPLVRVRPEREPSQSTSLHSA